VEREPIFGGDMLKNRTIQMKIVKDKNMPEGEEEVQLPAMNKEDLKEMTTFMLKKIAVTVIVVTAAVAVVNTISEVIVNKTDPQNKD
jgi:ABC-type antimicrobial peptide transport system permease subunit